MHNFSWLLPERAQECADFYQALASLDTDTLTPINRDLQSITLANQLHTAIFSSLFLRQHILKTPSLISQFAPLTQQDFSRTTLMTKLDTTLPTIEFDRQLRMLRNTTLAKIIWRDFNRLCSLSDTTEALSNLADSCIQASLEHHYTLMTARFGHPCNDQGEQQPLLVLGMGKLGARELNLSSDIDLIFAYPEKGQTDNANKTQDNQEFFARLGQKIIHSLDTTTAEGFVFRVDMRLRPYGQSGALVSSFAALEDYYVTQGREWERYAMVKARIVAHNGHTLPQEQLMVLLHSFTYRKYIDFSVIEALRGLKKSIEQEVKRRQLNDDIKLGAGGIREIEFITQGFQLIRGGREKELQDNRLMIILPLLEEKNYLPEGTALQLIQAYKFLRNSEHAIQGYQDQQTQKLPVDKIPQLALARAMGFDDWPSYLKQLETHRAYVSGEFKAFIHNDSDDNEDEADISIWRALWMNHMDDSTRLSLLGDSGFENPTQTLGLLIELHNKTIAIAMQNTSRERLDNFMPQLLHRICKVAQPSETFLRLMPLIHSVLRRSAYLLLLVENLSALEQLIKLSQASPWIASQLSQHPALLDELLDTRSLYTPPKREELIDELRRIFLRIDADDLEQQMEALRHFRSAHALRVAACEVAGILPLMTVSDYLTCIAEAILEISLQLTWDSMIKRHGFPDGETRVTPNFIVVGYGKLGGIELSHGSDLDLVFIHNAKTNGYTNGERSIDNQTFYMRLGQKLIHLLSTHTASGRLYEVDMRLRPSGNSGMLTTSIDAFEKYQINEAWTWEHQALVRARPVAGDNALAQRFMTVRAKILQHHRQLPQLRADVINMRKKMRTHLGSDTGGDGSKNFHLKQDPGGIVDIEFMVQYAVLAWAYVEPSLVTYTDNIRILKNLAISQRFSASDVAQLSQAYKTYRSTGHSLTLQQQSSLLEADAFLSERQMVINIWQQLLG